MMQGFDDRLILKKLTKNQLKSDFIKCTLIYVCQAKLSKSHGISNTTKLKRNSREIQTKHQENTNCNQRPILFKEKGGKDVKTIAQVTGRKRQRNRNSIALGRTSN